MMNKNQEKQSTDAQDPNGELISTVTATVLQILKTTDQISGESKECKNNKKEPETVDLTGMFFCILERFWVVLMCAALCGTLMGIQDWVRCCCCLLLPAFYLQPKEMCTSGF